MILSFLNPWLWLGALAVAAPVWLHLRRKNEQTLVRFSAVRFLEDEPRARKSPLRFQNLFLLLLRTLAVLLIATAFTWPYLRRANALAVKESVVYILDNTLSHQADNGFNTDRDRVAQELSRAGSDVQVAVIELAAAPRVVAGFGEDRRSAKQKVQQLQPSFQRGSYLAAFRQANSLLANAFGQRKRIVLLGDNQANQWKENVTTPPFLRNVQLDLPSAGAGQLPNVWLSELRAQRLFLGDKSMVNFTMHLGHLGPARTARVFLQVNDQTVFNRTVELDNQPESISLQAQCETDPASWVQAEASVKGIPDSLEADNHVFCSVPPVLEGKVAILAQSPYLRTALSPEVMRGQWAARVLDPANLAAEVVGRETAEVLCVESAYLQSADARALVKRYLAAGGGVFLLVNRLSPAIDGTLRELGFEPEGMLAPGETNSERFQFVLSNHPIFHSFQSPDFGNLMDIRVQQYARLRSTAGRPLIFSETGDGLFFEGSTHHGKLFVCAFGLDRSQSSWPVHPTFIPFLDLTLQAARPHDPTPNSFAPGDSTLIQLPSGTSAQALVLRENGREIQRTAVEHDRAQVRMPPKPGLYSMTFDDHTNVQQIFSVNPPAKESELVFLDSPKTAKAWCFGAPQNAKPVVSLANTGEGFSGILQQRLWWWMVLGGLLALTSETVLTLAKGEQA